MQGRASGETPPGPCRRHRIVTVPAPRMAIQNPPKRQPAPAQSTEGTNGIDGVLGASRRVTASRPRRHQMKERGKAIAINSKKTEQWPNRPWHGTTCVPGTHALSFFCPRFSETDLVRGRAVSAHQYLEVKTANCGARGQHHIAIGRQLVLIEAKGLPQQPLCANALNGISHPLGSDHPESANRRSFSLGKLAHMQQKSAAVPTLSLGPHPIEFTGVSDVLCASKTHRPVDRRPPARRKRSNACGLLPGARREPCGRRVSCCGHGSRIYERV